jgi:hypothetical protein
MRVIVIARTSRAIREQRVRAVPLTFMALVVAIRMCDSGWLGLGSSVIGMCYSGA